MSRYLNPYTDFGFKKLFGEEANTDLLIDFLNSILPEKHQVKDLTFRNTEGLPQTVVERRAIFDIFCESRSGEKFIVEMQKAKEHFFRDRSVFYVTFPIREQAQVGDWNFELKAVYQIAILGFKYDEKEEKQKLLRDVSLKDQDGEEFYDKLHFIFFQMPLFTKTEWQLETRRDKWLYFLKNLESFDHIPTILNEPIFERAFETAELSRMNADEIFLYEQQLKAQRDNFAVLDTARMEGKAEGIAEGIAEGKEERSLEIARNLKRMGLDTESISKGTGLSFEEIERLD